MSQPTAMQQNLVALGTIVRREVSRIMRIWGQTLMPPAITMTLYFLIFGGLIGSRVGTMDGIRYMDFIVPGLVMMSVIQNSYGNISSSFFGAKFGRHIEELLVSPMPNWVILGGYVAGAVLRGVMVGAIVLCIAMLFTKVRMPHPLVLVRARPVAAEAGRRPAQLRRFFETTSCIGYTPLPPNGAWNDADEQDLVGVGRGERVAGRLQEAGRQRGRGHGDRGSGCKRDADRSACRRDVTCRNGSACG